MKRVIAVVSLGALLGAPVQASAQWVLSWGSNSSPACYTSALSEMCLSAQFSYAADGNAVVTFWNRENFISNTEGGVDGFGFAGIAAPTNTAFTALKPDATAYPGWSYDATVLGESYWGWVVSPGSITDIVYTGGGNPAGTVATTWGGTFGSGGAVSFSFFLGLGVAQPSSLQMFAHVRNAYQDAGGDGQSDRWYCGDSGSQNPCFEDIPGGPQETVPEPATMTLLATGLAGMAAASRRRRRKTPQP